MCSIPPPPGKRSQKQPPGAGVRLRFSDLPLYVWSGFHQEGGFTNEAKATSGFTTSGTDCFTSKPFDEAVTTSAPAGAEAASSARTKMVFMKPSPLMGKMPCLGRAVQNRVDLCRHFVDRRHSVDLSHQPALGIVRQDRRGLGAILGHARAHRFLIVVGAALKFMRTAGVANPLDLGLLEGVVITSTAMRAGEAARDAHDQLVLID